MNTFFVKDPDELLDYTVNWSAWLDTDTISTSQWSVPPELTLADSSKTPTTATAWLSGGADDALYMVQNKIQTAGGRVGVQSFTIRMEKK